MPLLVYSVEKPECPPFEMSGRFKHDIIYFASRPSESGGPSVLAAGEWWVRREDALRIDTEGVVSIVSPLDSSSSAELEITEEQEAWLKWMIENEIEHIRLKP